MNQPEVSKGSWIKINSDENSQESMDIYSKFFLMAHYQSDTIKIITKQ